MHTFEVESKFQVTNITEFEHQLQNLTNRSFGEPVTESDTFFQHPSRDFVQTDECLRLRSYILPDGNATHSLTYKGAKIAPSSGLPAQTKTRQEIEVPITEPENIEKILMALGFRKAAYVHKTRRRLELIIEGRHVVIVFDTLAALPESRRHFVEIETLSTEQEIEASRMLISEIARRLGLNKPVEESYLKLVTDAGRSF